MSDTRGKDRRKSEREVEEDRRQGDRRRWRRVPVELWGESSDGEATYFHQAADLSIGGIFFTGAIPQPVGTVVKISIDLSGKKLNLQGVVVNTGGRQAGMGVQFCDLGVEDKATLEQALD